MTIGNRIKQLRQSKGLSQPALAEHAGIEQSYLSKLENDKSIPSSEIFTQLLHALDVTVEQFMQDFNWQMHVSTLRQIAVLQDYIQAFEQRSIKRRVSIQWLIGVVIVVAVGLFYTGYSKELFGETVYVYESQGVIFDGEPNDIFSRWHSLVPRDIENRAKLVEQKAIEMQMRQDTKYHQSYEYLGDSFEHKVSDGRRIFHFDKTLTLERTINAWLKIAGVMLFVAGVLSLFLHLRNMTRQA